MPIQDLDLDAIKRRHAAARSFVLDGMRVRPAAEVRDFFDQDVPALLDALGRAFAVIRQNAITQANHERKLAEATNSDQAAFHCPGRVAAGPGSMPVCGAPDWNHDEHDYPAPSLKPTRGQPHDSESLDGCEGVRWGLSWGFRLNVGHDSAEDPTSPLTIGACFSDTDQARGIVVRETSPEQLEEFARLLLNVAAKHRQRMATRPNTTGADL